MARRKNKKQNKNTSVAAQRPAPKESPDAPQQQTTVQPPVPAREIKRQKQTATPTRPRGMRLSSCVAGMFLTFILGLYLGSLMPGLVADFKYGAEQPARETSPAPAAAPQSVAKSLPPQKKEVAQTTEQIPPALGTRIAELESIVSSKDQNVAALIELGNLYFDTHQPKKAISAYQDALAISPNNADVLTDMGIMYREDGEYASALDCFRRAIAVNPAHQNAMYNEGVVLYHDLKRKDEAIDAWKRLLGVNPDARAPDGKLVREMIAKLR